MRSIYKIKRLLGVAVLFQFLMAGSILLMPMVARPGQQDEKLPVLIGLMFWISAIAGYVILAIANSERKKYLKKKVDGDTKMGCRVGIAEFFSNVPAKVADVTMILSFLLFIAVSYTAWRNEYIAYVLLFLCFFSLHMHCLFNGRIYKLTKYKHTRRE